MLIRELFVHDVTRDIPPVVYFHEQSPTKLAEEVGEYIVTGGYPPDDPRAGRARDGIHEQFVGLLRALLREMNKRGGPELPASWISGFYGSGKSSFAKLLGLALDGVVLPDGTPLATALLQRDDSPRRQELVEAWAAVGERFSPLAVVFDIGSVARDGEHIHSAILRQVQLRLGYCPKSNLVAEHELRLERDGEWDRFSQAAEQTLGKPWSVAMREELAEDHFSHVLHVMQPQRYRDPTSWIDSRAGSRTGTGSSVKEAVDALDAMLAIRAEGKTLFLVVDEVSQYVHQDDSRMLKLQSCVSELGQRLKGAVWLFATGQQKLEEAQETSNLGKLKDRFPPALRVHLSSTNIRDVVHKRLLKKKPGHEAVLRELFQRHRSPLKLYGYDCEEVTEQDFVEVYPMLPGHVDLLMRITSSLRTRSSRVQGDSHAVRGLLQLLGELFRKQALADREVGTLVSLDVIFEVQRSALDGDVQATLQRLFLHPEVRDDELACRAARVVALLELIQEQLPTTPELVARCLYRRLGDGNSVPAVTDALERLRGLGLVSYSEKQGFKIQSSAGQEWQRERDGIGITPEEISEKVREAIKLVVGSLQERPRFKGRQFPWTLWYSDGRLAADLKLQDTREDATAAVDFRFLTRKDDRAPIHWVPESGKDRLRDRLVWVVGDPGTVEGLARDFSRSERMLKRYRDRRESLTRERQRLLFEEEAHCEEQDRRLRDGVAEAFFDGDLYFRGQPLRPRDLGGAFGTALINAASRFLQDIYPFFTDIAVSETELAQLLKPTLSGPSTKFFEGGLGILSLDAGRTVPSCNGAQPSRILQYIQEQKGVSGQLLIGTFVAPPYGCPADVIKACCAGLLRAKRIRIRPDQGEEISSHRDPGVEDLFKKDRDFRRADLFPAIPGPVGQRERVAMSRFFQSSLRAEVEPEEELLADAVFQYFPGQRERLRRIEELYNQLPERPPLPEVLDRLGRSLTNCCRSRQIQRTVEELLASLDGLRDGLQELGVCESELKDEAIQALREGRRTLGQQARQLGDLGQLGGLEQAVEALREHLERERPWKEAHRLQAAVQNVKQRYAEVRRALIHDQSVQVEAARARVEQRAGFERLTPEQAFGVVEPLAAALIETTPEAIAPSLVELRDGFAPRLQRAEEQADDRLDAVLLGLIEVAVVKVPLRLQGEELGSVAELEALLARLRERLEPHLAQGARVRIV